MDREIQEYIHSDWKVYGELPLKDAKEVTDEELTYYTQDLLQINMGSFLIDIGWYLEAEPNGSFRCRVIKNENWQEPIEDFCVSNLKDTKEWLINRLKYYRVILACNFLTG